MSQPVYSTECSIWPGTHEVVPDNVLATSIPSIYVRLCVLLVDNDYIQNYGRNRYFPIVRDMWCPISHTLEMTSYALAVIFHIICSQSASIDLQPFNDFTLRVLLCALNMVESPLYSGHTVQTIFILVKCIASRPAILAVPADEPEEEEEEDDDDEYEDEEEQEQEQEGEQEEQEEEQEGELEEVGEDQNDNQQELPAEALVTALVVDGVTCMVCREELEAGSMASRLPCLHFYHEPCIRRWLTNKRICPNCRFHLG